MPKTTTFSYCLLVAGYASASTPAEKPTEAMVAAARSVDIALFNNVAAPLKLMTSSINHGVWTKTPPSVVAPQGSAAWASESNGFMTGTEGAVTYALGNIGHVYITWQNAFMGSNAYVASAPEGCEIKREGGDGNNAHVSLTLTCDSQHLQHLKDTKLATAARSVDIVFCNGVGASLQYESSTMSHGILTSNPPMTIQGTSCGSWSSESNGFMTGVEGTVIYSLGDVGQVSIWWDNPYVGNNDYKVTVPTGCKVEQDGGAGKNAQLSYYFTCSEVSKI